MQTEILRGWKDICGALGGMSKDSARELMKNESLPIKIVKGKPMTTHTLLKEWLVETCQN